MKALALAFIAFGFYGQAMAGGTIGGVPPSVVVDTVEFARIAADAVQGLDVVIDNELMQLETMDFKERTMIARSKTDPSKAVMVKAKSEENSSF